MGVDLVVQASTTERKESRMFLWTIAFASKYRETLSISGRYWFSIIRQYALDT